MAFNDLVTHRLNRWAESLQDLGPVIRGENTDVTIAEIRQSYISKMAEHPTPADVRIEQVDMGGGAQHEMNIDSNHWSHI